jgi:hypothetical protein
VVLVVNVVVQENVEYVVGMLKVLLLDVVLDVGVLKVLLLDVVLDGEEELVCAVVVGVAVVVV